MPPLLRSDILFFYLVALIADKIDGFVAHLFDRGVPTARLDAVHCLSAVKILLHW
jgi:phosphatidylserine synthase